MSHPLELIAPKIIPPLDQDFRPAVLANRNFQAQVGPVGVLLVIGLERCDGEMSRFETTIFPEGHSQANANLQYIERLVKFLLWQRGGFRVYIGGARGIGEHIRTCYAPEGSRKFDYHFMGEQVYEETFEVVSCKVDEVPALH